MVKGKSEPESASFLLNEKRRCEGIPYWGFGLALLQIAALFLTFPAIMKQFWGYFFSLGHPFYVDMIVFIGAHISALVGSNLMMFCIYKAKHPFFQQLSPIVHFHGRNVFLLIFNVLVFGPFMGRLMEPDIDHMPHRYDLESWPSLWQIVWQIVFCTFCEDFMFYCTHRTLHTRLCYKYIHKRHHEYTQPVSIGGEFAHPIEFLFGNALPFQFGPILLQGRCHKVTIMVWIIYRIFESADAHSGYEFPWSPYRLVPFSAPASYHNYHHTHNKGNYATFFSLWDTVFGTNKSYNAFIEKRQKKSEKEE